MPEVQKSILGQRKKEAWKVLTRYPQYEISTVGRIRRIVPFGRYYRGRLLTPFRREDGRIQIRISGNNNKVHRLVAETFLGPCPLGLEVNHKDCNPSNNAIENLEYISPLQNRAHAILNRRHAFGERTATSKLTDIDVVTIRHDSKSIPVNQIAKKFNLDKSHVYRILRRAFWNHLPPQKIDSYWKEHTAERRAKGNQLSHAKLTVDAVKEIRRSRKFGSKLQVLADKFNVSIQAISFCAKGKTWKHVQ